jgi:hypothetical protein
MAFALHEKISIAEARQWLLNAREEWTGIHNDSLTESELEDLDKAMAVMKPVDFKAPRKKRATKTSSSTSERSEAEYDEVKCDARVWLAGGFDAQCSCKKIDGQFLCNKHQKEADKHDGVIKNGFINADRPTHHYGDESEKAIPWHDVVIEKPAKGAKKKKASDGTRKPRKCGCCGEIGHDKRSCPKASTESSSPMMTIEQAEAALAAAKLAHATQQTETSEETTTPVETPDLDEDTSIIGAGVGITEDDDVSALSNSMEETLVISADDVSDDEDESDDIIDCTFEDIPYSRNSEGIVVDDDGDQVGEWVDDAIKFDRCGEKQHRMAKAAL